MTKTQNQPILAFIYHCSLPLFLSIEQHALNLVECEAIAKCHASSPQATLSQLVRHSHIGRRLDSCPFVSICLHPGLDSGRGSLLPLFLSIEQHALDLAVCGADDKTHAFSPQATLSHSCPFVSIRGSLLPSPGAPRRECRRQYSYRGHL